MGACLPCKRSTNLQPVPTSTAAMYPEWCWLTCCWPWSDYEGYKLGKTPSGCYIEYSHFRNYAPPLDEKGGIIMEKVFPVFSERVFWACFGLVI